jgi:hypothetical protein
MEKNDPLVEEATSKNTKEAQESEEDKRIDEVEKKEHEYVHKLEVEAQPTG